MRKRKLELVEIESVVATRASIKRYSPKALGQDSRSGGGAPGKKGRFEVLGRMAKIGAGLSPMQKMIGSGSKNIGITLCLTNTAKIGVAFSLLGCRRF